MSSTNSGLKLKCDYHAKTFSFLFQTHHSLFFSSHKHSWGLKMYIRERENERENIKLESVEHRSGDDRKEKERSIYRERRSVERSQVNKLVCKLYLRHCKTTSYYLTSFLFSISIVMLYTTNIFGQYHISVYMIKFLKLRWC